MTIRGQQWIEGGHGYHSLVDTPTFIVHGVHDSFISVKEDYEMMQVYDILLLLPFLTPKS